MSPIAIFIHHRKVNISNLSRLSTEHTCFIGSHKIIDGSLGYKGIIGPNTSIFDDSFCFFNHL